MIAATWFSSILQTAARPFVWWCVVAAWEQGLRVRLGKTTTFLHPGLHFRIPFLDRIYVQSTRTRVTMVSDQSVSTFDGSVVTLGISIQYRIQDIVRLFEWASHPEGVLLSNAMAAASRFVSQRSSREATHDALQRALDDLRQDHGTGLELIRVVVTQFCVARTYRLISGHGWIGERSNLDSDEVYAGEKR